MRKITVMFTKKRDNFSKFLSKIAMKDYSHASLSLEDDINSDFYSFNVKGFKKETIEKFKRHGATVNEIYQIEVAEDTYLKLKRELAYYQNNKAIMKYSYVGLFLCILRIPFKLERHYFCSQFIAEILKKNNIGKFDKSTSLYLPEHLRNKLINDGWKKLETHAL